MVQLVLIIVVFLAIIYYAFDTIMSIQYKLHRKEDYPEKEFESDKRVGGILVTVIIVVLFVMIAIINN